MIYNSGMRLKNYKYPDNINLTIRPRWKNMRARCNQPNNANYKFYGARGVKVCARWKFYVNFLDDMGLPPTEEHTLDRIDNNGNYEPGNCRWATRKEQTDNRSTGWQKHIAGKPINEWAKELGLHNTTIRNRIKRGWSVEDTLSSKRFKKNERT